MQIIRYFVYVVAAALISAFLGGIFGGIISLIAPSFVAELFDSTYPPNAREKAMAFGAILGLFMGTAVICFGFGLMTIERIAKQFLKPLGKEGQPADDE